MGVMHSFGNRLDQTGRTRWGDRSVSQRLFQTLALDESHGIIMVATALADIEDGHDVRMIQVGGRSRLGSEPNHISAAGEGAADDHLEGHDAAGVDLNGAVDDSHAAPRHFLQQLVITKIRRGVGRPSVSCSFSLPVRAVCIPRLAGVAASGRQRGGVFGPAGGALLFREEFLDQVLLLGEPLPIFLGVW